MKCATIADHWRKVKVILDEQFHNPPPFKKIIFFFVCDTYIERHSPREKKWDNPQIDGERKIYKKKMEEEK